MFANAMSILAYQEYVLRLRDDYSIDPKGIVDNVVRID